MKLLYLDLFCGAGGTSTGVEQARVHDEKSAKVIACVNHDANAIASHAANHPDALHFTEDIRPHGQDAALLDSRGTGRTGDRHRPRRYSGDGEDKRVHGPIRYCRHQDANAADTGAKTHHGISGRLRAGGDAGRPEEIHRQRGRSEHGASTLRSVGRTAGRTGNPAGTSGSVKKDTK